MPYCKYPTDDGTETFMLGREVEIKRRNGLYVVGRLSAGALQIGGVPVSFDDGQTLHVAAKEIRHCPNKYKLGQLELLM